MVHLNLASAISAYLDEFFFSIFSKQAGMEDKRERKQKKNPEQRRETRNARGATG